MLSNLRRSVLPVLGKCVTVRTLTGFAITYREYGDPEKVLEFVEYPLCEALQPDQVLVKMLAAPINPADINMIQGKYAIKPKLPATGGNEGVGEVIRVGSAVTKVKLCDLIIPNVSGWGTWKTHGVCEEENFTVIDPSLSLVSAATIAVNPCTAYRMLLDFVDLKEGDTFIQNGANSGVGQAAIQIAKARKINSINVIRERPNLDELKNHLLSLGATYVVVENELRSKCMEEILQKIPKPSLALNCVGGKNAAELVRHMQHNGTMVTYGGMSKQPLTISTASLIFNDIRYVGFWMTQWNKDNSAEKKQEMLKEITELILQGKLKPPLCKQIPFMEHKKAISDSMKPFISEKQILIMNVPSKRLDIQIY